MTRPSQGRTGVVAIERHAGGGGASAERRVRRLPPARRSVWVCSPLRALSSRQIPWYACIGLSSFCTALSSAPFPRHTAPPPGQLQRRLPACWSACSRYSRPEPDPPLATSSRSTGIFQGVCSKKKAWEEEGARCCRLGCRGWDRQQLALAHVRKKGGGTTWHRTKRGATRHVKTHAPRRSRGWCCPCPCPLRAGRRRCLPPTSLPF